MRKEGLAAVMAILVVASLGIGYLSGSSARGTQTTTSTSTSVSTSILTSQMTITSTTTSPLPKNTTLVFGVNGTILQVHVPWSGVGTWFLGATPSVSGGGPALVDNMTEVVVFDCASQTATAQGCTREVNASVSSAYEVTIWYPYSPIPGQAWPAWANCEYSSPYGPNMAPAYCISLGFDGFIVAMPQPGPG